jgi:hypothetical protein
MLLFWVRLPFRQCRSALFGISSVTLAGGFFAFRRLVSLLLHPGDFPLLSGGAVPVPAPLAGPSHFLAP